MRVLALGLLLASLPAAASATPAAQAAYVERRGLLEADARCHLFTPEVRAALLGGAGQARGALLRGGSTRTNLDEIERATVAAARERACTDPRTLQAAEGARAGFAAWTRLTAAEFPGWERSWTARRFPDLNGWRLSQDISATAAFGVRGREHAALTLLLATTPGENMPTTAQLVMRDPARTSAAVLEWRQRAGAASLDAGAPSHAGARYFLASARRIEPRDRQHAEHLAFEFPDAAFQAMLGLDPREAVEILLQRGGRTDRLLVEVGDIAAARVFLAARAAS